MKNLVSNFHGAGTQKLSATPYIIWKKIRSIFVWSHKFESTDLAALAHTWNRHEFLLFSSEHFLQLSFLFYRSFVTGFQIAQLPLQFFFIFMFLWGFDLFMATNVRMVWRKAWTRNYFRFFCIAIFFLTSEAFHRSWITIFVINLIFLHLLIIFFGKDGSPFFRTAQTRATDAIWAHLIRPMIFLHRNLDYNFRNQNFTFIWFIMVMFKLIGFHCLYFWK